MALSRELTVPKQMCFHRLYGFICDMFLNLLERKLPKFSQHVKTSMRDKNFVIRKTYYF